MCGLIAAGLATWAVLMLGPHGDDGTWAACVFAEVFLATMPLFMNTSESKSLVIGSDGISVKGLFRTRFIPRRALTGELSTNPIALLLRGGRRRKVVVGTAIEERAAAVAACAAERL